MQEKIETIKFRIICIFLMCYFFRIFSFPNELIVILGGALCVVLVCQQRYIKLDLGICLLSCTMLSYYLITNGIRGIAYSIVYIPIIIYILSRYMTADTKVDKRKWMTLLFTMIIGYSLHGFLNSVLYFAGFRVPGERRWLDIWTQQWMLGTHHAVFFLPAMALLVPAVIFFRERKWVNLVVILTAAFFLYTSLATRSRTPVLAMAIVIFVQMIIYVFLERKKLQTKLSDRRIWIVGSGVLICAIVVLWIIKDAEIIVTFKNGLSKGGGILNNVRFVAQKKALEQLFLYPMGGRQMNLGRSFCHNTWLDMANAAGLIPFFSFVGYTILSLYDLIRYILNKDILSEKKLMIAGIYVAFFMFFTVEPALDASVHYLTPWIFINGMVHEELWLRKK